MPAKKLLTKYLPTIKKIFFTFFLLAFFSAGFFFINNLLSVKEITVIGNDKKNTLNGLSRLMNQNLLYLSEKEISADLQKDNPWIESAKVTKTFPNKLTIDIDSFSPIALLHVNNGFFYLSKNGQIVYKSKENKEKLPVINYYQKLSYLDYHPGNDISYKDVQAALFFIERLNNLNYAVDTVDIAGFYMIRFNLNNQSILFSTEKDIKEQGYQLEQIIKRFKITGVNFSSLDLRFDKPVIKIK